MSKKIGLLVGSIFILFLFFGCVADSNESDLNYLSPEKLDLNQPLAEELELNQLPTESNSAYLLDVIITKNEYLVNEKIEEFKLTFNTEQEVKVLILVKFVEDSSGKKDYYLRYGSLGGANEPKGLVSFLLARTFDGRSGVSTGNNFGKTGSYTIYGAAYDCSIIESELEKSCKSVADFSEIYGKTVDALGLVPLAVDTEKVVVK